MKRASQTPSKISIPPLAHPLSRLVFKLMREGNVTYKQIELRSGILRTTLKSHRCEKFPSLPSIEALLGAFDYALVPLPPLASLSQETLEAIESISLDFISDNDVLAAAMLMLAKQAGEANDAALIEHRFQDLVEVAA